MPLNKPLKTMSKKLMTGVQLAQWEAGRDLEAEIVESARQMKRGEGAVVYSPVIAARQNSKLSQAQFAQRRWIQRFSVFVRSISLAAIQSCVHLTSSETQ
jgi:hypothetical protein